MDTQHNSDMPQQQSPMNPQGKDSNRKLKKWNIIIAIIDVILLLLLIFWPKQCGCNRTPAPPRVSPSSDSVPITPNDSTQQPEIPDSTINLIDSLEGRIGYMGLILEWNKSGQQIVDYDAHAIEPTGEEIYYYNHNLGASTPGSPTSLGGCIDIDMVNPPNEKNPNPNGIENIRWTDKALLADGVYKFFMVHHTMSRNINSIGFKATIYIGDKTYIYDYDRDIPKGDTIRIADLTLHNGELADIKHYIQPQQ